MSMGPAPVVDDGDGDGGKILQASQPRPSCTGIKYHNNWKSQVTQLVRIKAKCLKLPPGAYHPYYLLTPGV